MRASDTLDRVIESTAPDDLPELAGDLATALVKVCARAGTPPPTKPAESAKGRKLSGRQLDVREAAERLGVTVTWLYRHSRSLPFALKLGHRTLRFDADGLERWLAAQRR